MDIERTLETQRLKLLRIVAGLWVVVGVLAIGPVSRRFFDWTLGFVGSILLRAEAAAKYQVIAQMRLIVSRSGMPIDQGRIFERLARIAVEDETDLSLSECRWRLKRLRAVLMDIPHYAARLLRRIEKQMRRASSTTRLGPVPTLYLSALFSDWELADLRIERPPERDVMSLRSPPNLFRAARHAFG